MFESVGHECEFVWEDFRLAYHGQALRDEAKREFQQYMRSVTRNQSATHGSVIESMVACVLLLAMVNGYVGPGISAICIPKASAENTLKSGYYGLGAGGIPENLEVTYFHMAPRQFLPDSPVRRREADQTARVCQRISAVLISAECERRTRCR
jgi:hypothetical protein